MKYPEKVQEIIDFIKKEYVINEKLDSFQIFHLYPEKKVAYPNGYYDSRFFNLIGFNIETMEKRDLGRHDGLTFHDSKEPLEIIRIFADGSTLVKFKNHVKILIGQDVTIL